MRIKTAFAKYEIFVIPSFGFINERNYYGYPVIAVAFAWLQFRIKIEFGVKRYKYKQKNTGKVNSP